MIRRYSQGNDILQCIDFSVFGNFRVFRMLLHPLARRRGAACRKAGQRSVPCTPMRVKRRRGGVRHRSEIATRVVRPQPVHSHVDRRRTVPRFLPEGLGLDRWARGAGNEKPMSRQEGGLCRSERARDRHRRAETRGTVYAKPGSGERLFRAASRAHFRLQPDAPFG